MHAAENIVDNGDFDGGVMTFTEMQRGKLEAGQTYELSFNARTLSGDKDIYVFLGQNEGIWMNYIML